MITILSVAPLYFLFRLKSQFENSRFQTSNLNPIKSENMAFIKRTPQSSILNQQCRILFCISEVALRLLLTGVTFCTSRDVHHVASWLQIPAEGSGLEHIYTCNRSCSFALLRLHNPIAGFSPTNRSKQLHGQRGQPRQACGGGDSVGEHVGEPAPPTHEVRLMFSAHGDDL